VALFKSLAKQFPTHQIEIHSDEYGNHFHGSFTLRGGQVACAEDPCHGFAGNTEPLCVVNWMLWKSKKRRRGNRAATVGDESELRARKNYQRLCAKQKKTGSRLSLFFTILGSMAEEGIDLATLAKILRHNSIRIVERYVLPTDEHTNSAMLRYESTQMIRAAAGQSERP
jgi:hypothetical protein